MRKVRVNTDINVYKVGNGESSTTAGHELYDGYFHGFVNPKDKYVTPYVVVEDMDGFLHTANMEDVQFIDKPDTEPEIDLSQVIRVDPELIKENKDKPDTTIEPPKAETFDEG